MNKPWQMWVEKNQGYVGAENRLEFPDMFRQVAAVRDGNALAMLDGFSIIRLEGEDAEAFLQGQLSGDIRDVTDGMARFSTYSTAKGRMLASFLIWKQQGAYYLLVSTDICQAVAKRLTMFVMRSKVKVQVLDAEQNNIAGVRGAQLQAAVEQFFAVAAPAALTVLQGEAETAIALPEGGYLLQLAEHSALLTTLLAAEATAVSSRAWNIRDIDAGIAWVEQATQEQFVPQMANMELIGAVSFKKGCYPGQEIVARTQYLGKLKRRLFKARLPCFAAVGSKLFSPELPEQSIGMIAGICPVAEDMFEALVVVQSACWEKGVYLEPEYSNQLECLVLPYVTQDE
ncbi:MAG: folate-binding protein YgfZ [Aquitalea sp.]|nr:folate-binding protein YgfZ [Aquitalea sp.]